MVQCFWYNNDNRTEEVQKLTVRRIVMKFKIGFSDNSNEKENSNLSEQRVNKTDIPVKSLVQVRFPDRNMTLSYYNDLFDLHRGDLVFVDGKLEGLRGIVVDVSYNFKIKLSDYKRVIAVADTTLKGELHMALSHFVTFDSSVLPYKKVLGWFKAPSNEEDEIIVCNDDSSFVPDNLSDMKIDSQIADRGYDYYMRNKVVYICVDNTHGRAIVTGSNPYEVEFTYKNGEISNLLCDCFCSYTCKHEFAAMLQLRETLKEIEKNYADKFEESDYFAAISKSALFKFCVDNQNTGSITFK